MPIRIALLNDIHLTKSTRKKMHAIWNMFCRWSKNSAELLAIEFLPFPETDNADLLISRKEGPYQIGIPPMEIDSMVRRFSARGGSAFGGRKDMLREDVGMHLFGLVLQELSKRIMVIEYVGQKMPEKIEQELQRQIDEIFTTTTNAEIAIFAQDDHGSLVKTIKESATKLVLIFMFPMSRETLDAKGFFKDLAKKGWLI